MVLGSDEVKKLPVGAKKMVNVKITIPSGTSTGDKHLIVKADSENVIAEITESNSTESESVTIAA